MAFDPRSIRKGIEAAPRKVVIHGKPKVGKSPLVGTAQDVLLVPTEDRVKHVDCAKTEVITKYEDMLELFEYLVNDSPPFRTLAIDTLDSMEPMLHDYICRKKGFKSLHDDYNKDTAFFRGLKVHAVEGWRMFLQNCDIVREQANMNIILIVHSIIERVDPPDNNSYDRYSLKLDKWASAVVLEWADIIGFYHEEIVVSKSDSNKKQGKALNVEGDRILHLQPGSPAWVSGNCFGLPDCIVTIEDAPEIMRYILNTEELEQNSTKKTNNKKEVK